MTQTTSTRSITASIVCAVILASGATAVAEDALVRIERQPDSNRNSLIEVGVSIVAETNDAWLAVGDPTIVAAAASRLSLPTETLIDEIPTGSLAIIGLRGDEASTDLAVCGRVLAAGDGWRLVVDDDGWSQACLESSGWFIRTLDLEPLKPHRTPPSEWADLADGGTRLVADPLVQEMVDLIDTPFALSHWAALSESPFWTTRHSESQGCVDAAGHVYGVFAGSGLQTEYQHHTSGFADNVIGTLPGSVEPDKVYIAIGHLDDLPSSGPAPGADDNASGTAMVTAAAEVMACYRFARTVKFLAVTGEEQGLHGSDHYADLAATQGEDIQAVLNGDMIGWEGDGQPAIEDLDINYNSASQWLAQAMIDSAAEYGTGITINAISCSSMTYSDHAPFWANGYSAICGITDNEGFCGEGGNYPFYHQSSDTIANCGPNAPDFEAAAIRTYVATLAHLAQPIARVVEPPMGLAAQPDGENRISLTWAPQSTGSVFRIFRAPGGCSQPGPWVLIAETGLDSYVDMTASGGLPYGYTVVAADSGGCVSPHTACAESTTTGACTEPPTFIGAEQVTNAATSSCQLTVDWSPPDHVWCGGPVSYNVYRSTDPGFEPSPANRIANGLSATTYDDLDVVSGEDYSYVVRAVDQANGNEDSNTRRITGSPTGPAVVGTWTDDAGDTGPARLTPTIPWNVAAGAGVTGAAYATGPYSSGTCAALITPEMLLDAAPSLEFWSKFDIEDGWDKGELQVSTDGGGTWTRVTMVYPGGSGNTNDSCGLGTGTFFTGTQNSYAPYTANLGAWAGQTVTLRWLFSSDGYIEADGWWIDDVSITDVAVPGSCVGGEAIFADGFESGDTGAWLP